MRTIKLLVTILFLITNFNVTAFASETVSAGDSGQRPLFAQRGPCLQWFLFFCLRRGSVGDTPSFSPRPRNQPLEPAMTAHLGSKGAPIMGPFNARMATCANGCSFTNWGVWGDKRHQVKRSCHNSGSAIDVHAIKCSDGTHKPGSARFSEYVQCMGASNQLSVIFGHGEHKNHVHISLTQCEVNGIGKIRTR